MLSLVIGHSLIVIVEANLLRGQEDEAAHLISVFLRQVDKVLTIFLLRVCVINHNAVTLFDLLLGHFVAFLLGF